MAYGDDKITAGPAAPVNPIVSDNGTCQSAPDVFAPEADQTAVPAAVDANASSYADADTRLDEIINGKPLPPLLAEFNIPYPTMSVDERLAFFNLIPETNLTAHTRRLIRAGELREYFKNLTPEDFATRGEEIFARAQELSQITYEVISLRTSDGFDPLFGIARLRNEARSGDGKAVMMVFDLHMRTINGLDESKALGTWAIDQNREFFQDEVKHSRAVYENLRVMPTIVQMRNRTAFVVIGANANEGETLKRILLEGLERYPGYMAEKLLEAQANGVVPPDIDPSSVTFGATGYFTPVNLNTFSARRMPGMELDQLLVGKIQPQVSTTAWLKKAGIDDPAAVLLRTAGVTVYGDRAIQGLDTQATADLQHYVGSQIGFVPFGVYIPYLTVDGKMGSIEQEQLARLVNPDLPMQVGELTRRPSLNGGGDLEHFMGFVASLTEHPERAQNPAMMKRFAQEASNITGKVINMGAEARADAQLMVAMNPVTKWHGEPANFFVEQASGILKMLPEGYKPYLFNWDVNDGGKFAAQYPPVLASEVSSNQPTVRSLLADEHFQSINWLPYKAANEMGLPPPVFAKEGDQGRGIIFAPDQRTAERFGELTNYLVQKTHESRPILLPDGSTARLSLSISLTGVPDFTTPEGVREFSWVERRNALHAEYLKHKNLTENGDKAGVGWMPEDFAVSLAKRDMLDPETLKQFDGGEIIPIMDLDLGPLTNPIDDEFNKIIIEVFLPGSIPGSTEIVTTGDGLIIRPNFGEPLPPPEPMITPIQNQPGPIFACAIEAQQSIVKGFVGDLVAVSALEAYPVSFSSMNFATPRLATSGATAAVGAIFTIALEGAKEYAETPPPSYYNGLEKTGYFLKMSNRGIEKMMDNIDRSFRYSNCRSNPDRECLREFGFGIGSI